MENYPDFKYAKTSTISVQKLKVNWTLFLRKVDTCESKIGHFVIVKLDTWASSVQKVSKNDSELIISKTADKLPIIGFLSAFFVDLYGKMVEMKQY